MHCVTANAIDMQARPGPNPGRSVRDSTMLRFAFICAVALSLAGCESDADFLQPVVDAAFGPSQPIAPATPVAAAVTSDDARCQAVAYARAADAKANGFDDDLQETVYSGTYAECAAWDSRHSQVQPN
jgi:hypothetical protein